MRTPLFNLRKAGLGLGLAVLLGTAAATAYAAAPPAPPAEQGHDAFQARRAADAEARLEARLAFVKSRLRITQAQTPQWNAFAAAMRNMREQATERRQAAPRPGVQNGQRPAGPPSVLDRLNRAEARLDSAKAHLTTLANAVRPLYAALTDDQKRIADRVLMPRHGRHRAMMDRHGPRGRRFERDFRGPDGRGGPRDFQRGFGGPPRI